MQVISYNVQYVCRLEGSDIKNMKQKGLNYEKQAE